MKVIRLLLGSILVLFPGCAGRETAIPEPAPARIVAVGDLHGDLDATRRALRLAGAIDADDHWIGGRLTLVQTGDILDRGDQEQAILDLFVRLESEAAAAGGGVYRLHGNHELMNVALDFRYVTPGGYADFQDAVVVDSTDGTLSAYDPEQWARVVAFRPGGPYARILADAHLVLVLDGNLFVHGGVLPAHIAADLAKSDAAVRDWLLGHGPQPPTILNGDSPVWTRRFSDEVDSSACATLDSVLTALDTKRMIVGHTVQHPGITLYCDQRVWCIDVGMAAAYGGEPEVLEIRGDTLRILRELH